MEIIKIEKTFSNLLEKIHKECFIKAWNETAFLNLLKNENVFGFIATKGKMPCGFILCQKLIDEAEILTICTLKNYRKQGVANKLLKEIEKFPEIKNIFLEVAFDNTKAINLYKKNKFKEIGIRKNYYRENNEQKDAIILKKEV